MLPASSSSQPNCTFGDPIMRWFTLAVSLLLFTVAFPALAYGVRDGKFPTCRGRRDENGKLETCRHNNGAYDECYLPRRPANRIALLEIRSCAGLPLLFRCCFSPLRSQRLPTTRTGRSRTRSRRSHF